MPSCAVCTRDNWIRRLGPGKAAVDIISFLFTNSIIKWIGVKSIMLNNLEKYILTNLKIVYVKASGLHWT